MQKEPTKKAAGKRNAGANPPRKLSRAEKKQIAEVIRQAKGDGKAHTAQQTIPYIQMYPDGICKVSEKKYSKSIAFEDINYQLAQADDKTAIFENWCDFLNYFDASVSVQLSFINQGTQREQAEKAINIPAQDDAFNSIRTEYSDMLKNQLSKGNNGLVKHKYITFSIEADNPAAAKARLSRIETDVLNNFKVLGAAARPMTGYERLNVLHGVFHPEGEPFRFDFSWLAPSGLSTKDFIAPDGKKKSYAKKGFATKKEATQHEAEMKTKLQNPGQIASITSQRKQTVASYLNDWVESYARVNLRPSTYDGYKKTIANYINPYIGGVALNQLTPAMVDKMFQQIIDKGLKPSTAAGAKRVLSVALSHARKYRYIETNAAKDTLTKFGKSDKTPDPYTPEQVKALMQRVEGTVWEMPVILGGLYGMRRSEILGLRWRNVDLENNTFDVSEQLPFKVPPKTKVIEEMAPPKSNGRKLPITELARPFFLKQFAMQEAQREQAGKDGKPYYDNDLVVAKPDGSPISASWVSSQFGKLLEDLDMPHIRFHDLRHTAATNMHQLTGDFYTVGEVLGHTLAGIGVSLGLSMNFEAVTARYVDVRLERKKEVLDAYHGAVKQADPAKAEKAEPKKAKSAAKKKSSDLEL
ncbi:TPA: tyrosine-type recombinase/integrase [Clostridioides difficile]